MKNCTWPPSGIAWMALMARFVNTCWICPASISATASSAIGREDQADLLLLGNRIEHVDRLADDDRADRPAALRGVLARAKSRSCRMIAVILSASSLIAAALCGDLFRIELAGADQPCPAGDDVQRRAQFMGDARGQPADGFQAIGVAKLLQGRDPRGGFLAKPGLRFGQVRAHGVEVLGQFRQFVAGTQGVRGLPDLRRRSAGPWQSVVPAAAPRTGPRTARPTAR